ncbi:hypothetical protein GGR42_003076 [Saonia flava]|uniref:Uncharacterized protein n=1 Tax=Saonia flava TaxID=523696 RepID=A0A846R3N9_9FLAO|nr:hypothetical protein [Saonia flava]
MAFLKVDGCPLNVYSAATHGVEKGMTLYLNDIRPKGINLTSTQNPFLSK